MDTKGYAYLAAIERCRSVPRAARELGMTPQGLARAMRRMEEDLGCTLYEGSLGTSALTEQGACVLEHGSAILAEEHSMRHALDAIAAHAQNIIRLGCSMGLLGYLGEGVFEEFNRLARGEYDYALLVDPPDASLASIPMVDDYQFVWMRRSDPLARAREVTPRDLDGRTIYTLNDEYRNTSLLVQLCAEAGARPTFRFTSEMIRVYECARAGMGLGITCRNHVEATAESQTTVGLPLKALPWRFSLCYRRDHVPTPTEARFMDYVRAHRKVFR